MSKRLKVVLFAPPLLLQLRSLSWIVFGRSSCWSRVPRPAAMAEAGTLPPYPKRSRTSESLVSKTEGDVIVVEDSPPEAAGTPEATMLSAPAPVAAIVSAEGPVSTTMPGAAPIAATAAAAACADAALAAAPASAFATSSRHPDPEGGKGKDKGKSKGMAKGGAGAPATKTLAENALKAKELWSVYEKGFAFPRWSLDMLEKGQLESFASKVIIYYSAPDEARDLVKKVALEREPVNIAMHRKYYQDKLKKLAGYQIGGYGVSTPEQLMPNIAAYCRTPCRNSTGAVVEVNVINLIGYAFDSVHQPDYKYFFRDGKIPPEKWEELVSCTVTMWRYAFECARWYDYKRIFVADVGGGAFATLLNRNPETQYNRLKEEAMKRVRPMYPNIEVQPLGFIPDMLFKDEMKDKLKDSLFVNAWDPWSMVGNGNAMDNSLDGFFGRCSAMAVLCWPLLNPYIRYVNPFHKKV
eukprot:TRINITY_DN1410_c0_g2_i1.p1 TRINITY_DN1410_c0_g2~~TRINITY_DN1410_c0_g2_i1.p1  ORF type:complete len:466 (-),score=87.23 TRINITY_DN1410_c0_g2_i1:271-1668(-)